MVGIFRGSFGHLMMSKQVVSIQLTDLARRGEKSVRVFKLLILMLLTQQCWGPNFGAREWKTQEKLSKRCLKIWILKSNAFEVWDWFRLEFKWVSFVTQRVTKRLARCLVRKTVNKTAKTSFETNSVAQALSFRFGFSYSGAIFSSACRRWENNERSKCVAHSLRGTRSKCTFFGVLIEFQEEGGFETSKDWEFAISRRSELSDGKLLSLQCEEFSLDSNDWRAKQIFGDGGFKVADLKSAF